MLVIVIFSPQCKKEKINGSKDSMDKKNGIIDNIAYITPTDSFFVDLEVAQIYATYMNAADTSYDGEEAREIESDYPILDEDEIPCMWVFNYEDGGWLILSADYRHEPIMAYNHDGSFLPDTIPPALGMWIDASIESINLLRTGEHDNTFEGLNAWRTTHTEYNLVTRLTGKRPMPTDGEDPQDSLCIRGIRHIKGPLLQTTWGQNCTYNDLTPSCSTNCDHAPTGCVATAIAQVMHYFNKPSSSFNYSIMSLNNGNAEVQKLMEDMGDNVSMDYDCSDGSGATFDNYKEVLENSYGYSNSEGKDYNLTELLSNITNNKPVILKGCHARVQKKWWQLFNPKYTYDECHAWVCDGYTKTEYCTYTTINYLHMNWGWHEVGGGNDYNGMYRFNSWNIANGFNFQYINKMVSNITP